MRIVPGILLIILFFNIACSYGQENKTDIPTGLDKYVSDVMETFNVPGVSIAIVKDGKTVLTKGYGIKTIGKMDKVDDNTLFCIASNSKAFTAAALALLVEEGKIEWDKPVIDYMPWFRMSDSYVTSHITVRDLLVHHSGLGLGAGDLLQFPPSDYNRKEIVEKLKYIPLKTGFRSEFAYDNILYLAAGELIESVTGQSWEDFIKTQIFNKIGMTGSVDDISLLPDQKNIAAPHAIVDSKLQIVKPYIDKACDPAGGIISNAADMAKWMIVQLDSGSISGGGRLFSPASTIQLWNIVTPINISKAPEYLSPIQQNFYGYALGFWVTDYRHHKIVTHTGGLDGYVSKVTLLPELKLGITVLTNQESSYTFSSITNYILDYYLKAASFEWLSGYKKFKAFIDERNNEREIKENQMHDSTSLTSLPLEKYTGVFNDKWYGNIKVSLENGHLILHFLHSPDLAGDLVHWQYNTFVARWRDRELRADAFVTFDLNPDGSIDEIKMAPFSPETDFSYDFQDLLFKPVEMNK